LFIIINRNKNKIMSQNYDVAVIGGGPGGYVAAIRAA
jgi:succinate dehydrogenase/fumarate reductase flavoprotein subunit